MAPGVLPESPKRPSTGAPPRRTGSRGGEASRRAPYVGRACGSCRRRKAKCDGSSPCSGCTKLELECSYTQAAPPTERVQAKAYASALQARVQELESVVDELQSRLRLYETPETVSTSSTAAEDQLAHGLNRLKLDRDTSELLHYGITSPLHHLPSSPASTPSHTPNDGVSSAQTYRIATSPTPISDDAWRRNLPYLPLWDRAFHDDIVSRFFRYFANFHGYVSESAFLNDLHLATATPDLAFRTANYSRLLHCAILAHGCCFSDDFRTFDAAALAAHAISAIPEEGDAPKLSAVQGLLVLSDHFAHIGSPSFGYLVGGLAFRLSRILGLHIDAAQYVKNGTLSETMYKERLRVFWSAFFLDKLWSSYTGRAADISLEAVTFPLPPIDPALDIANWTSESLSHDVNSSTNVGLPSCASSTRHWVARLSLVHADIMEKIYDPRVDQHAPATLKFASELSLKLEEWSSALPAALHIHPQTVNPPPAHNTLLSAYFHFIVILLYRPYYSLSAASAPLPINLTAIERCDASAGRIIHLLKLFHHSPGLRYAPAVFPQFVFLGATIHLLRSRLPGADSSTTSTSAEAVSKCIQALRAMGTMCRAAVVCADILSSLAAGKSDEKVSEVGVEEGSSNNGGSGHAEHTNPPAARPPQQLDPHFLAERAHLPSFTHHTYLANPSFFADLDLPFPPASIAHSLLPLSPSSFLIADYSVLHDSTALPFPAPLATPLVDVGDWTAGGTYGGSGESLAEEDVLADFLSF